MGNLSKNFSLSEFACHHCGLSNPNPLLIRALQQYRDLIGVPVHILSGGRCATAKEPNPAQHRVSKDIYSNAADIVAPGKTLLEMYRAALEIELFMLNGIGIYPRQQASNSGFLHLDVRGAFARWSRLEGRYRSHQTGLDYIFNRLPSEEKWEQEKIRQAQFDYRVPCLMTIAGACLKVTDHDC